MSCGKHGWACVDHPAHRPAGGGKPAPALPGNLMALKHAANVARLVDPMVRELVDEAITTAPYLDDASYRAAVESWATAESKARLLDAYLATVGVVDEDGKPRPALGELRLWEARASAERDRLGLTPLSRARLGRDITATKVDVAMLMAELSKQESEKAAEPPIVEADGGYRTSS